MNFRVSLRQLHPLAKGFIIALGMIGFAFAAHSADLNGDGQVDKGDLQFIIDQWRGSGGSPNADLNHDGTVNAPDAGKLLSDWGGTGQEPLNIVYIVTDDQRADTVIDQCLRDGPGWTPKPCMPKVKQLLMDQGVTFTNYFATMPLCCPNRSTILSGLYTHNHGVLGNKTGNDPENPVGGAPAFSGGKYPSGTDDPDDSTAATWLKGAGYRTALIGKYLNVYPQLKQDPWNYPWPYVPPGWDIWRELGGYYGFTVTTNSESEKHPDTEYSTDYIAAETVKFIEETPPGTPLFAYVAPYAPHGSGEGEDGSAPVPHNDDDGDFANLPPWRPSSHNEADITDKPSWLRTRYKDPLTPTQIAAIDFFAIKQIESLQAVDRAVEKIVDALSRTKRLDKTVIIFTSDNGYMWGEHRLDIRKHCIYEECIRLPLIVRMPGVSRRVESKVVTTVDFAPTFAEFGQTTPSGTVNGRSMATLLRDAATPWRDSVLVEIRDPGRGEEMFYAVRTDRYLYGEYDIGDKELYDLQTDPYQLDNFYPTAPASLRNDLKAKLDALKAE